MFDFGYVVLIVFIAVRILIAAGLFYLIVSEVRRYKGRRSDRNRENKENGSTKDLENSSDGRD
ncbi:hypothetical protein GF312_08265 [Candidatus Poribacteria bacterium]|nr:hypothetical protein [Candidatus Poribacteria bacterium]